jgi:hypothetical protein
MRKDEVMGEGEMKKHHQNPNWHFFFLLHLFGFIPQVFISGVYIPQVSSLGLFILQVFIQGVCIP